MNTLLYGLLLGIRLALPADVDELPRSAAAYSQVPEELQQQESIGVVPEAGGLEAMLAQADEQGRGFASAGVTPLLTALVEEHRHRLACILRASMDENGVQDDGIEAGGYIGGSASTIMVHDGRNHAVTVSARLRRLPHIHVWPPPDGALAWVHTHHPNRGLRPSAGDLAAAVAMRRNHQRNLPFLVITPRAVSAYWHGFTVGSVTLAGANWWQDVPESGCARTYQQGA